METGTADTCFVQPRMFGAAIALPDVIRRNHDACDSTWEQSVIELRDGMLLRRIFLDH
jgi:hypothetical protein